MFIWVFYVWCNFSWDGDSGCWWDMQWVHKNPVLRWAVPRGVLQISPFFSVWSLSRLWLLRATAQPPAQGILRESSARAATQMSHGAWNEQGLRVWDMELGMSSVWQCGTRSLEWVVSDSVGCAAWNEQCLVVWDMSLEWAGSDGVGCRAWNERGLMVRDMELEKSSVWWCGTRSLEWVVSDRVGHGTWSEWCLTEWDTELGMSGVWWCGTWSLEWAGSDGEGHGAWNGRGLTVWDAEPWSLERVGSDGVGHGTWNEWGLTCGTWSCRAWNEQDLAVWDGGLGMSGVHVWDACMPAHAHPGGICELRGDKPRTEPCWLHKPQKRWNYCHIRSDPILVLHPI